jgi:hypothetical protein
MAITSLLPQVVALIVSQEYFFKRGALSLEVNDTKPGERLDQRGHLAAHLKVHATPVIPIQNLYPRQAGQV